MEDTILALNTGYARTRDGAVIERAKGKVQIINPAWRAKMDRIVEIIEGIRKRFHESVGFTQDSIALYRRAPHARALDMVVDSGFRNNLSLSGWMDTQRQEAIETMNSILCEVGYRPLTGIR